MARMSVADCCNPARVTRCRQPIMGRCTDNASARRWKPRIFRSSLARDHQHEPRAFADRVIKRKIEQAVRLSGTMTVQVNCKIGRSCTARQGAIPAAVERHTHTRLNGARRFDRRRTPCRGQLPQRGNCFFGEFGNDKGFRRPPPRKRRHRCGDTAPKDLILSAEATARQWAPRLLVGRHLPLRLHRWGGAGTTCPWPTSHRRCAWLRHRHPRRYQTGLHP
jgi:hypothetical protein